MKIKLFILFLSLSATGFAQSELCSFTATGSQLPTTFLSDYQCLGINPANLGWKRNRSMFHLGILEVGISAYSDALEKKQVKQDFLFNNKSNFTLQDKINAAETFANSHLALNADFAWLSFALQTKKLGGIAFSVREKVTFNSYLNKDFAQIVFEGFKAPYFDSLVPNSGDTLGFSTNPKTLGTIANGTKISATWYREHILGYGKRVLNTGLVNLYLGADVKYILGYGMLSLDAENNKMESFSSFTPLLNINYSFPTSSQISGNGMTPVGKGYGFDFGATAEFFKVIKISAALNNIGYINWNGNAYELSDTLLNRVNNKGFAGYNFIPELKKMLMDSTVYKWKGVQSRRVALPANARLGMYFSFTERTGFGIDCLLPINNNAGNFDQAIVSMGGNFGLFKIFTLSAALATGGNSGFTIPVGIVVSLNKGKWDMGIASRDAITFFKQDNPTVSTAFGFLRFNFGKIDL